MQQMSHSLRKAHSSPHGSGRAFADTHPQAAIDKENTLLSCALEKVQSFVEGGCANIGIQ